MGPLDLRPRSLPAAARRTDLTTSTRLTFSPTLNFNADMNASRLKSLWLGVSLVASIGCNAHGGDSAPTLTATDGGTGPTTTPPPGGTLNFTCAQFCDRLASTPGCTAGACMGQCQSGIASAGACAATANALYACTRTATVVCARPSDFPYMGCEAQLIAYSRCAAGQSDGGAPTTRDGGPSVTDAGGTDDAGMTPTACLNCAIPACADEANACLADTSCAPCIASPDAPGCSTNDTFDAFLTCSCGQCADACAPVCN